MPHETKNTCLGEIKWIIPSFNINIDKVYPTVKAIETGTISRPAGLIAMMPKQQSKELFMYQYWHIFYVWNMKKCQRSWDIEPTYKITISTSLQTIKTFSCYLCLQVWMNESNIGSLCGIFCSVAGGCFPGLAIVWQSQSYVPRINEYLQQSIILTKHRLCENLIRMYLRLYTSLSITFLFIVLGNYCIHSFSGFKKILNLYVIILLVTSRLLMIKD